MPNPAVQGLRTAQLVSQGYQARVGGVGPAAAPPYPAARVEIAFAGNPTATPTWIDVTQWVQSFSIQRGRQRELNAIQTGTAQVLLDNRDRRFDPTNASGPYYGNILPMRRLRISGIWQGVAYLQFTGYIESWPQTWSGPSDANVPVTVADGFKVLNLAQLNASFAQERSDQRIADVLTTIGWTIGALQWVLGDAVQGLLGSTTVLGPVGDRNLGVGLTQIQPSVLSKTSALAHMQNVAQTENGFLFMGRDGRVTFLPRQTVPPTSQATFGELELQYTSLILQYDDNQIYNEVRITRNGGTEQVFVDSPSKATYFDRTLSMTNTLHVDDAHTGGVGSYLLSRYKQPFLEVVSMGLDGTVDPTNQWPQILNREIGDCITVNRRPPGGGSTISQVSIIQGISLQYTANGGDWLANWQLTAADTTQFWALGIAGNGELSSGPGTGHTTLFY